MYRNIHHITLSLSLVFILCMNSFCSHGQDLTGTWKAGAGGQYVLLVLTGVGDTLVGYTYDRMSREYCKANFKGTFNAAKKQLKGEGLDFIENDFGHVLCIYKLTYRHQGDADYLVGTNIPKLKGWKKMFLGTGENFELRRISKTVDTTAYMAAWWKDRQAKAAQEVNGQ